MTSSSRDGIPYVDLGTSDNVAWDQPRVAVELIKDVNGTPTSLGPGLFNTMLLDTGANSVLAFHTAIADMTGYETDGLFEESGVAGSSFFDISLPYRFDFAGTSGERNTLNDTRIISDAVNDISIFGPWGIVGMPAMIDRVTTLDFTVWETIVGLELYMGVEFRNDAPVAPDPARRYTVEVDNRISFEPEPHVIPLGDAPPVWADIPFLSAYPMHNGQAQQGNFLFDTGAQLSVFGKDLAIGIGLDSNGDGELDENDANFARYEAVGGIGGTISAPVFLFDEVHVPTAEGVDLVWTDLQWLVLDILPGLDGVLGSDLLSSGWIEAFGVDGKSGWIDQVQLDFREMSTTGPTASNPNCAADLSCGKIFYDLNEQIPKPIDPNGPGAKIIEDGGSTTVSETGVGDAYQILLTQQPAADVTITLSSPEGQLTAVNAAQPTSQTLIFTPSNWNVPQTVQVAAVDDSTPESFHRSSIFHTSSSSDPNYQDVGMPRVIVNIIDDDYAGVMIIPTDGSTDVTEGGGSDTYDVVLTKAPTQNVTFQLEYAGGQVVAVDDSNPATSTLLFTPSNWNTPQTVRVTAVDDTQVEGPHTTYITHRLSSADEEYQQVYALQELVTITDNDAAPPQVANEEINGGNNRSGVASVAMQFDQAVTVSSAAALEVYNQTTGSSIDLSAATLEGNGTSAVTWDLSSVNLPNGRYTAELPADAATNAGGLPLASTHTSEFFVVQGDVNGDEVVNFADYGIVGNNFDPLPGAAYRTGDANGDGLVNFADYGVIGANFNPLGLAALPHDFGDAPETGTNYPTTFANNGAVHVIGSGLFLGSGVDSESGGQPHTDALGDDNAGDDEDGVSFGSLTAGANATITVDATVPSSAVLNAWVDFNADGDWSDLGEQIFTNEPLFNGSNALSFSIPAGADAGDTFARFRVTTSADYSFTGLAPDGEVEDYKINIGASAAPSESGGSLFLFVAEPSDVETEYPAYQYGLTHRGHRNQVHRGPRSKDMLAERLIPRASARFRLPTSSNARATPPPLSRTPASALVDSGLIDTVLEDALFVEELTGGYDSESGAQPHADARGRRHRGR